MAIRLLRTGQAYELMKQYGLVRGTLDAWIKRIPLTSYAGGNGYGDFHQWTTTQIMGMITGIKCHRSVRSCSLSYIGLITRKFKEVSEEHLLGLFEEGNTHLIDFVSEESALKLSYPSQDRINIESIYNDVIKYIEHLKSKGYRIQELT